MNPDMAERDQEICKMYLAGKTLQECGTQYGIRRQRVKQILKEAGVWRPAVKQTSERDEFLGLNISTADKVALRAEAARRGISMSALSAEAIKEMLAALPQGAQQ